MDTTNDSWSAHRTRAELALALLRVIAGVILLVHGWLKLTDVSSWQAQLASMGMPAPELLSWFAIAGEFLGGLGLIVGLLTPVAALGGAATMVTAIATVHAGNGLLASNGGMEFPLLLLCVSLVFVMRGGGPLSLDALWVRAAHRRSNERHATASETSVAGNSPPHAAESSLRSGENEIAPPVREPKWSAR